MSPIILLVLASKFRLPFSVPYNSLQMHFPFRSINRSASGKGALHPYLERKTGISAWRAYVELDIQGSPELLANARRLHEEGIPKIDSLHLACAIAAGCEYFITTDDRILKCKARVSAIHIADPILFIKERGL
jgi:hypothetical protein